MTVRNSLLALATAGVLAACGGDDEAAEQARQEAAETRALMAEIYSGLRVALPASADVEKFAGAESRAEVAAALELIAARSELLEQHSRERDQQMAFLARSVRRDAEEVRNAYEQGRYPRASYLLRRITENCVVCHTRLPALQDSPIAKGFLDLAVFEELPLEPRATLLMATRQFDPALDALEELLLSPNEHAAMLTGALTDYLVINIRVRRDFERPIPTLQAFAKRRDLWTRLRLDVEGWIAELPRLERRANARGKLETARELFDEGKKASDVADDRTGLAHFVVASSVLQRFIDDHKEPDAKLAEAFYLLGVIEARIGRNYWVTSAPFLLEKAIRMAPDRPFAQDAFALLERETFGAFEGSDWEDLPAEDAARLDELRRLVERGSAQRADEEPEQPA